MPQSKPYQPLAFRILHGSTAALIILALITGLLIYNVYDARIIGKLPIPDAPRIMGIHKLFGRLFLLGMPFFALYSFHAGQRRLIQPDSLEKLKEIGKPIWWYTLHRIVNTLLLVAATLALITGRQVDENWMRIGDLTQVWYTLHLASWLAMFLCLATHLLMSAKVGGIPLIVSIVDVKYRPSDSPATWPDKIKSWLRNPHL